MGHKLTRNLSGNIWPQLSQLNESLWTYPGIKIGICVCELISTLKKKKKKKLKRRQGMNSQTFSQNPCKRGKSHHHVAMITSSLHFPQRPHETEVNHVNFVIFLPMQTRHSCLKKKKRSIFTTVLDYLWSAVLCTCLKHSCPQCCLPCCCSAAAFWNLHPIPEQCAEPSAGLCHCPFACRLHTAKGR